MKKVKLFLGTFAFICFVTMNIIILSSNSAMAKVEPVEDTYKGPLCENQSGSLCCDNSSGSCSAGAECPSCV